MTFQQCTKILKNPLFFISWFGLAACSYYFFDLKLAVFIHHAIHPGLFLDFFEAATWLGHSSVYLILSVSLSAWGFFKKNQRLLWTGAFIFLSIFASGVICDILKIILGRARPMEFFRHDLYGFYFWQFRSFLQSFPSGHATIITAVAIACSFLLPRYWSFFFAFILLVDASRMILLAHYLSDVMVGSYLGFIVTDRLVQWPICSKQLSMLSCFKF